MNAPLSTGIAKKVLVAGACVLLVGLILCAVFLFRGPRLHGMLIDLELREPDPSRHGGLREKIALRLPREIPGLRKYTINLDYLHFTSIAADALKSQNLDFLILSPQATPWSMYAGEPEAKLNFLKHLLRELVERDGLPVLGICGGLQFMALAFGGEVDFIDPEFMGKTLDSYPKEAVKERGVVWLETLSDDPIFEGVVRFPGSFRAVQSHFEEVKALPRPFVNLARSNLSEIQLIRFPGKTVYGLAFHPERRWEPTGGSQETAVPEGKRILANFMQMVASRGKP